MKHKKFFNLQMWTFKKAIVWLGFMRGIEFKCQLIIDQEPITTRSIKVSININLTWFFFRCCTAARTFFYIEKKEINCCTLRCNCIQNNALKVMCVRWKQLFYSSTPKNHYATDLFTPHLLGLHADFIICFNIICCLSNRYQFVIFVCSFNSCELLFNFFFLVAKSLLRNVHDKTSDKKKTSQFKRLTFLRNYLFI